MFSYCSSFFKKPDDSKLESKKPLLELVQDISSMDNNPLSSLENKLSSISERSQKYFQNKNCLTISIDAALGALAGASSTGLGYLIYQSPPNRSLVQCLNLVNTTITDYCQNKTVAVNECQNVNDGYCEHYITIAAPLSGLALFMCIVGISLAHIKLKEYFNEKYNALDQQLLRDELNDQDHQLLSRYEISGNSSEMLKHIKERREEILVSLSEAPLQNKVASL
jgi:hypothetical protein